MTTKYVYFPGGESPGICIEDHSDIDLKKGDLTFSTIEKLWFICIVEPGYEHEDRWRYQHSDLVPNELKTEALLYA